MGMQAQMILWSIREISELCQCRRCPRASLRDCQTARSKCSAHSLSAMSRRALPRSPSSGGAYVVRATTQRLNPGGEVSASSYFQGLLVLHGKLVTAESNHLQAHSQSDLFGTSSPLKSLPNRLTSCLANITHAS